jgi:NitT/TauT family transport system substrate-binding protein
MDRKRALGGAIFAGVLAGCIALLPGDAAAQGAAGQAGAKTVVNLGVSGRPDQAALELAFRRGYFDQLGLDVRYHPATSGNEFVAPLARGQLDVASGSPNAALFNALNREIDIRIVADFAHIAPKDDRLISIVARKDLMESGALKTVADLKGRSIGAGNSRGQVAALTVYTMLKMNNISPSDVDVKHLNFPDALGALSKKTLDATFLIEPLTTQGEKQNILKVFKKGSDIRPGTHLSVVVYSPTFVKNTDAANKFMVAYLRGVRDYHDAFFLKKNRDAAIDILVQHLPMKDRKVWEDATPQTIDLNGKVDVADLKAQAAIYREMGDVSGAVPDLDRIVDPSFARAAVKVLGAR